MFRRDLRVPRKKNRKEREEKKLACHACDEEHCPITVRQYRISLDMPDLPTSTVTFNDHFIVDIKRSVYFNYYYWLLVFYLLSHMSKSCCLQSTRYAEHGYVILTLGEYLSDPLTHFWKILESHTMMMS